MKLWIEMFPSCISHRPRHKTKAMMLRAASELQVFFNNFDLNQIDGELCRLEQVGADYW